ncbi:MAG TPA: hypothetical protein VN831_16835 [Bradyrhizobium sp.]|jgi:hypothetical protein|nr:hypothetical protein [Bradyrhizobium sp.]
MAVVIAALLPVFLLIVLGFILKRSLMPLETQWHIAMTVVRNPPIWPVQSGSPSTLYISAAPYLA